MATAGDGVTLRNVREDQAVFDAADTYIENHRKTQVEMAVADINVPERVVAKARRLYLKSAMSILPLNCCLR